MTHAESETDHIEVRAYFTLAPRVGHAGKKLVKSYGGRTLEQVARAAGLDPTDVGLAMVNGCRQDLDYEVQGGDRVAFFPDYVPFHKAYGMCVL
ncbi:MAG: hypothetical protein Kow00129_12810 [Thermoleophilia bacterium]